MVDYSPLMLESNVEELVKEERRPKAITERLPSNLSPAMDCGLSIFDLRLLYLINKIKRVTYIYMCVCFKIKTVS
jgi:hypothetical protein